MPGTSLANLLLYLFEAAELKPRLPAGFLRVQARAESFVGQQEFVGTDFVIQFALLPLFMEQIAQQTRHASKRHNSSFERLSANGDFRDAVRDAQAVHLFNGQRLPDQHIEYALPEPRLTRHQKPLL
jgi:hypothetical protein